MMIAAAPLLFTACGQSQSQNSTCSLSTKVQLNSSAFTSSVSDVIPSGSELVVVAKDACKELGPISSSLDLFPGKTPAGVRSYKWSSPYEMTRKELDDLANDDACVTLVASTGESVLDEDEPLQELNDPRAGEEAHLAAIKARSAYDVFFNPKNGIDRSVTIAIIDSGVALAHEDLKDSLWVNKREIPGNGIDDDGNGYIDDVNGYNFASRVSSPVPQKTTANEAWQWAHGTRVAGLAAAATDNGKGVAGVAPNAKIMALNAMGTTSSFSQVDVANAIRYAVDNGARVINLSLGGSPASTDYRNALAYAVHKGVVVVAAAGNESSPIGTSYSAAGVAHSLEGLISIGNFRAADFHKSSTSNYSTTYVELGAPGTNTATSGLLTTSPTTTSSYATFSGTSAATPVAAGAAALAIEFLESRGYIASPAAVENLLKTSAQKVSYLKGYFQDGNALDLLALANLIDTTFPQRGGAPLPAEFPYAGGLPGGDICGPL